ncbi:hypothetical protein BH10PSE3_BH10PSE3_26880 [soil metagenome]
MEGRSENAGKARSRDAVLAQETATIDVRIDEETMAALLRERDIMGDHEVEATIQRRLTKGLMFAIVLGADELKWHPIHRDAMTLTVELPIDVALELEDKAGDFGYGRDVLVATILSNEICKPMDVVSAEARQPYRREEKTQVRRVPGKGNLYPVHLFIPGYQLVFMRMLANREVDRSIIIDEALLALARRVMSQDRVAGIEVSGEARIFARRMLELQATG